MPLDWSRVGASDQAPLVVPREIYAALPQRPWPYLRHEQGEVLEGWFARRTDRDVVIKQNTGGGKTAVGLLIAQSTMNEGIGKAVYLAPDKYLVGQVRVEAAKLGIATTDDPRDSAFRQSRALLVATFHKLINGLSVFGVVGDDREKIDLGIVIVDDAHAALATAEGQFRLTVEADHSAYPALVDLFAGDLMRQSPKAWADVRAQDYTATVRVPFWTWSDNQSAVMSILHPHAKADGFKFVWPLIADVLPLCAVTVSSRSVELRPPCLPIAMIPAFYSAARRVYLTATLSDDSILITDLDADPKQVRSPVAPGSAADLGDRLILAPISLNRDLEDDAVRILARQFADGDRDGDGWPEAEPVNVVVLVPSKNAAAKWSGYADRTHYVGDLETGVAELKAGHVGLVVLVNKYDGVDLPDGACRLLILDGIPRPMDSTERREAAVLSGSETVLGRQVQRIEQGMGRGVRDSDDYCAVLLLGSELAVATYDPRHLGLLSPATRAQVKLSMDVASQIQGAGLGAVREAVGACLSREPQWVAHSRRALADIRYAETSTIRPEAVAARDAFDLAVTGRFQEAADRLHQVIKDVEGSAERGLLLEQRASYLHRVDPGAAQRVLAKALDENPFVLRPIGGVTPSQLRSAAVQASAASAFLAKEYKNATSLVLGVQALLDSVIWGDEERSSDAEIAWDRLGQHLGLTSERPEKKYGTGPDNLWVLATTRHAVIELKTGCTTDTIAKSDLDQLGGSVRWDQKTYQGIESIAVMAHPSNVIDARGTAVPGMRVVTPAKWEELKAAVRALAVALADGAGRWDDNQAVAQQLAQHKLTAGNLFQTYAVAPRPSKI